MPSATSRDFYANALGIPKDSLSINDLMLKFYRSASTLPTGQGSLQDNMYDFFRFKLGLTEPTIKSLNDVQQAYFKTLGVANQEQFEKGVLTSRTNLCINPNFETTAAGWGGQGSTITRVTAEHFEGVAAGQCVTTAVSNPGIISSAGTTAAIPLEPGKTYTVSGQVKGVSTALNPIAAVITTWDSVGSFTGDFYGSNVVNNDNWQQLSTSKAVAANQVFGRIGFRIIGAEVQTYFVDAVLFEKAASVGTYFDGNSPGARWLGAVNNSASQLVTWSA